MTAQTTGVPHFAIGKVLGTSFAVLWQNFIPFITIAAVISAPYIALKRALNITHKVVVIQQPQQFGIWQSDQLASISLSNLVFLILVFTATWSLISAALVYGTFQDLRGQRATIGEALGRGLSALIPVILASLVYSLFLLIGFTLLIVPGLMIMVALWVYVPAIIVEKVGVFAAFGRSRQLTDGRRWSIFGLFLILMVANWLLGLIVDIAFLAILGGSTVYVTSVLQIAVSAYGAVVIAVGYYYLRADKEGIAIGDIAKVFD